MNLTFTFEFLGFAMPITGFLRYYRSAPSDKAALRNGFFGMGVYAEGLGLFSLIVGVIMELWSLKTDTPVKIISMQFLIIYTLAFIVAGGIVMAIARPRR